MLRFATEAHPSHVDLPVEAATEKIAVVGVSGSGKTTLAAVLVEEVHAAGGRVVVLDTQGEWWSLRAPAERHHDGRVILPDGPEPRPQQLPLRCEGLPFVIFGGDHADLHVDAGMGRRLGAVLSESTVSAVVDASRIPARSRCAFFTDLLAELYEKNRKPLFVVVDEADLFAPQKPSRAGAQELLDAMIDVVRRGRKFGFGVMLITQRPAAVAKEVLSQAETLFVTRLAGEHDQAAIDRWLAAHVRKAEREGVRATLASLPTGEVWAVSPHWPGPEKVVRAVVRPRHTADASKTPTLTASIAGAPAPRLTPVHLAELGKLLGPETEGVGAQPYPPGGVRGGAHLAPRVDSDEVQRLRRELEEARARPPREVPVLAPDQVALLQDLRDLLDKALHRFGAPAARPAIPPPPKPPKPGKWAPGDKVLADEVLELPGHPQPTPTKGGGKLRMLAALRRSGRILSRDELATLACMSKNGGTFTDYLSALKGDGRILMHPHGVEVTDHGRALVPTATRPFTLGEVVAAWKFNRAQRAMLDALTTAGDAGCTRDDLAAASKIAKTGGTFTDYLSVIRTRGFLSERGSRVYLAPFLLGLAR